MKAFIKVSLLFFTYNSSDSATREISSLIRSIRFSAIMSRATTHFIVTMEKNGDDAHSLKLAIVKKFYHLFVLLETLCVYNKNKEHYNYFN
jgi:hypothetical protein